MEKNKQDGNVKVVCRFRPFNNKQKELGVETVHTIVDPSTIKIKDPKTGDPSVFNLDRIFDTNNSQHDIYQFSARPVVQSVLEGFNGTIFAYGQTSSGKTYTMQGYNTEIEANKGIVPRMVEHVFSAIEASPENIQFTLKVSIVELYNQKVRDLLDMSKQDLKVREHPKTGVYIQDVTQRYVSDALQLYAFMEIGNKNRICCSTGMNEKSSRSHMLFIISIHQSIIGGAAKSGKLFLVDLAGSEKIAKTGAQGKVLQEAKKINLSLTTLGKVIKALTESKGSAHVPYRESNLTRILQESLGGNSKTTLIITASPHPSNLQETLSTLRFGMSAKKITNKAKINKQHTVEELLKELEKVELQSKEKSRIIKLLEDFITKQNKLQLPSYKVVAGVSSEASTTVGEEDSTIAEPEEIEERVLPEAMQSSSEVDERVRILEEELLQRSKMLEAEVNKLHELKLEYGHTKVEMQELEKQGIKLREENRQMRETMFREELERKQKEASFIQINGNHERNLAALLIKEIMSVVKSDELQEHIAQALKKKKWYKDLELGSLDVNALWETEREKLTQDLQSKIERVSLLEKKLEEEKQSSVCAEKRQLEEKSMADAQQEERFIALEKNLQELYTQYYEVVELQSTWKAECQLYERKLHKTCKQVKQLEEIVGELRAEIENYKRNECDYMSVLHVGGNASRIIKPIRGGTKLSRP